MPNKYTLDEVREVVTALKVHAAIPAGQGIGPTLYRLAAAMMEAMLEVVGAAIEVESILFCLNPRPPADWDGDDIEDVETEDYSACGECSLCKLFAVLHPFSPASSEEPCSECKDTGRVMHKSGVGGFHDCPACQPTEEVDDE